MHNESALLLRLQQQQAITSPLLLINPPDSPGIYAGLNIAGALHANYSHYMPWRQTGIPAWFGCQLPDDLAAMPADTCVVLFLPKGRQRLLAQLQLLGSRVPLNSRLIVIGAVAAGIKSTGKKLVDYCTQIHKIDTARHCHAWSGLLKPLPRVELIELFTHWPFEFNEQTLPITSLAGVFADGHLDSGSGLLIDTLRAYQSDLPGSMKTLDFGCGSGAISAALAMLRPDSSITAVDNDAFALAAAGRTFARNNIQGMVKPTAAPIDLEDQFDLIVSNPPFHQGISQTTAVTTAFIQRLPDLLTRRGQAWIVANRFLNYEQTALASGLQIVQRADNRGYKVLAIKH